MFDIDSGKLLIVAVLALIVIGPKELPRVMRQVGQAVGKMRRMATDFQGQFMDAMKEADIADIRKELNDLKSDASLDYHFDPARDLHTTMTQAIEAPVIPAPVVAEAPVEAAEIASPTDGFMLPKVPEAEHGPNLLAEGIAPDVPNGAGDYDGAARPIEKSPIKRRILVKKRRSSFTVVPNDATAWTSGKPLGVRERAVRPKIVAPAIIAPDIAAPEIIAPAMVAQSDEPVS